MSGSDIAGIFQGDLIIKAAIELGLKDMREHPYVIEDVFRSLIENPLLNRVYGIKEIAKAKEFILNNDIPVYMHHRLDKKEYPCITIALGSSTEDTSLSRLGDATPFYEDFTPSEIGKPIPYIVPPFHYESYDSETGILVIGDNDVSENIQYLHAGMVLVDPDTGNGYIIEGISGNCEIQLSAGLTLPKCKLAVIPSTPLWRARREMSTSQTQYNIGCHVDGDPSYLIFLHDIVRYTLFRYKESLLETNNFQLSRLSSSDIVKNDYHGVENVYSRWITLSGQVEETWLKSPKRFIEAIAFKDNEAELFDSGIKIISKERLKDADLPNTLWTTIDGDDEES